MQCRFCYMVHHSRFFQISGDFIYIFSFYSEQHEDRDCYDNISTHLQENQCGVYRLSVVRGRKDDLFSST